MNEHEVCEEPVCVEAHTLTQTNNQEKTVLLLVLLSSKSRLQDISALALSLRCLCPSCLHCDDGGHAEQQTSGYSFSRPADHQVRRSRRLPTLIKSSASRLQPRAEHKPPRASQTSGCFCSLGAWWSAAIGFSSFYWSVTAPVPICLPAETRRNVLWTNVQSLKKIFEH